MRIARTILVLTALTSSVISSPGIRADLAAAERTGDQPRPQQSALVDTVRRATEPFLDSENVPDGYGSVLGCVSGPEEGAMGVHFVNGGLLGDDALDPARPEALIYEFKNGVGRLVGAEFIVFADVWHTTHALNDPPILEGQLLHFVDSPNRFGLPAFYELHVWAWRDNPNGAFVDWNPRVSCEGQ